MITVIPLIKFHCLMESMKLQNDNAFCPVIVLLRIIFFALKKE